MLIGDNMRCAVLVIDMLNDFIYGSLSSERFRRIIPNIRRLLSEARKKNIPVIYANDSHIPGVDEELKIWGDHAIRGTKGAEVIDELKPTEKDYIVEKRRYSAFFNTDLDLLLRELKVDTIIITGISTDVCVLHTAADAFFRGYKVVIPEECVEAFNEDGHRWALDYMKRVYKTDIVKLEDAVKLIREDDPDPPNNQLDKGSLMGSMKPVSEHRSFTTIIKSKARKFTRKGSKIQYLWLALDILVILMSLLMFTEPFWRLDVSKDNQAVGSVLLYVDHIAYTSNDPFVKSLKLRSISFIMSYIKSFIVIMLLAIVIRALLQDKGAPLAMILKFVAFLMLIGVVTINRRIMPLIIHQGLTPHGKTIVDSYVVLSTPDWGYYSSILTFVITMITFTTEAIIIAMKLLARGVKEFVEEIKSRP